MRFFIVRLKIVNVCGECHIVPWRILSTSADRIRERISVEWVYTNISDDWGPPLESVEVLKAVEVTKWIRG